MGFFIAILVIGCIVFFKGLSSRCPKCKKLFAMQEIQRQLTGTRATTIDVDQNIKNRYGETTGKYTQAVPATEYYYDVLRECRCCGARYRYNERKTTRD